MFCEQCGKSWEPKTLLRHIGQNKECRKFYGARFDEMKRKKHKETMQRSREKKGTKEELKTQRESYAKNPAKRKKKQDASNKRYHENREELSKEYRDKARAEKRNSVLNHKKYEESIKFGPLFICVC